ncbi:kinase-like protein [Peniophora sp. CONT]|nr:kinase-like protein [Peniophora sp. CONT]
MNTLNSISTLADALPLVYPSVDVEFLAHLVPIKEANQVLHHSPIGQFVTSPWTDPLVTTFVADGKIKCYFTWNGKKSFDKAEFTVTLCSKATMMVNDEQLVYGMPVDLHDCDTIQLFEFAKPTEGLPRIDVKFFYRIKHVFCSEKTGKTYMVLSRAGQGGYGTVHKCRNPDGEQRLAVKRTKAGALLPGGRCAESHEVVTLREIWEKVKEMKVVNQELGLPDIDPHVVMLRDHWVNGTSQLIVMDMALEDLHGRVSKNPSVQGSTRLVEAEVQSIARQVLTGLNFIHCMGYVHCDIKPANILMYGQREGAGDPYSHVVIADLGISQKETDLAKVAALGQTFLGTPGFLPPEVAGSTRVYSPLVDVWATGISLYYAYTGSYLFNGTSPELVQALTDQGEHLARLSELPCFNS